MVDPLEVLIAYLQAQLSASVGTRVAAKHRFASDWKKGEKCLVVRWDGGMPDLHSPVQVVRVELDLYGKDTVEIASLFGEVVALSRSTSREPVAISNGATALLQNFVQASGLTNPLYNPDCNLDFGMAFFNAIICEDAVITA